MVDLGPVARETDDGRLIREVPEELADDDLDWLNRYSLGIVRYERAGPVVDIEPDDRLGQVVYQ
jgi:hypothetical protein